MTKLKVFENPEVVDLFYKFLDNLFKESGRGALLLANSYIEEELEKLILAFIPDMSKTQKRQLFNQSGLLSTASAKLEFAYISRLIGKKQYDCLTALRKLRNEATHKSGYFDLEMLNDSLMNVYNLGPNANYALKEIAFEALKIFKIEPLKERLYSSHPDISREEIDSIFNKTLNEDHIIKSLEKQFPFWELAIGLTHLCAVIIHQKERIIILTKDLKLLSNLVEE